MRINTKDVTKGMRVQNTAKTEVGRPEFVEETEPSHGHYGTELFIYVFSSAVRGR
jgi:hypothetical protein